MSDSNSSGLVLLDKPAGPTSFTTISRLKRTFGTRQLGHTGTLDSFATGLLMLLVGQATRLSSWFLKQDKVYEARISFGTETNTLDPLGEVIRQEGLPESTRVAESLQKFVGKIEQRPPQWSAIHVQGKRSWERARDGEVFENPPREVEIYSIQPLHIESSHCILRIHCSSGTYIRSLARDLAIEAGTCAHVQELRRLAIGVSSIEEARAPEDSGPDYLLHGKEIARRIALPAVSIVSQDAEKAFCNGRAISGAWFEGELSATTLVLGTSSGILGVIARKDDQPDSYHYLAVFPETL